MAKASASTCNLAGWGNESIAGAKDRHQLVGVESLQVTLRPAAVGSDAQRAIATKVFGVETQQEIAARPVEIISHNSNRKGEELAQEGTPIYVSGTLAPIAILPIVLGALAFLRRDDLRSSWAGLCGRVPAHETGLTEALGGLSG